MLDEGGGLWLCSLAASMVCFAVRSAGGCSCQHLGVAVMCVAACTCCVSGVLYGMIQSLQ